MNSLLKRERTHDLRRMWSATEDFKAPFVFLLVRCWIWYCMLKSKVIFSRLHVLVHITTQVVLTEQDLVNPTIRRKDLERPQCEGTSGIFVMVCKSLCCIQLNSLKPPQVKRTMRYQAIMKEKRIKKRWFFHVVFCFSRFFSCLPKRQKHSY